MGALIVCLSQQEQIDRSIRQHSLQRVHAQALVHAGTVRQEGGQRRLEHQPEVQRPVSHALVHDRVAARLAHDQIGPLDDNDGHEEGSVTGELEGLAVAVGLRKKKRGRY